MLGLVVLEQAFLLRRRGRAAHKRWCETAERLDKELANGSAAEEALGNVRDTLQQLVDTAMSLGLVVLGPPTEGDGDPNRRPADADDARRLLGMVGTEYRRLEEEQLGVVNFAAAVGEVLRLFIEWAEAASPQLKPAGRTPTLRKQLGARLEDARQIIELPEQFGLTDTDDEVELDAVVDTADVSSWDADTERMAPDVVIDGRALLDGKVADAGLEA